MSQVIEWRFFEMGHPINP